MRTRTPRMFSVLSMAGMSLLWIAWMFAMAQAAPGGKDGAQASTEHAATTGKDQIDLSVTVYNSNLALVRDVRQIRL